MTVNANSDVTSSNTNSAYVSKSADDEKTGPLALNDGGSTAIVGTQDFINQVADSNGETEGDATRKTYSSEEIIANGDDRKVAIGKLDAQVKQNQDDIASTDLLKYQGTWDASTNTPTLADGTGTLNHWYRVNVAGSQDLGSGSITYAVNDRVVHNGSIWQKWDSTDEVTSVHGRTGDVVAVSGDYDTSEVTENTNLYYTEGRVSANTSVAANTAKVTNATHTGEVTGSTVLTLASTSITNKSIVTPVSGDYVLGTDASDSDNLKRFNAGDFLGGGGAEVASVTAFTGTSAPTGYFICDGSTVNRVTYAALYALIGDAYGEGDGSTTFHIPDFRGRFLRGTDNTAGNDPDAAGRTAINTGGNTGDNVGSLQADELKSHDHTTKSHFGPGTGSVNVFSRADQPDTVTGATGGNETRPKNVNINYIIKY